ncbi:MAG: hypothetical protein E6G06_10110 [Actinobacteria bacterium]|nr:MAG: hypothetical protein E6G06_10110 [Actinomycetota bacterium]
MAAAAWRLAFAREFDAMHGEGGDHALTFLLAIVTAVERRIADMLPSLGLGIDTRALAELAAEGLVPESASRRLQLCAELGVHVPGEPVVGEALGLIARHVAVTLAAELLPLARAQYGPSTRHG